MTTPLQAEASRRNGTLSKGPVTEAGKHASRANSLMHGLSGAGTVLSPDEAEEVDRRQAQWNLVLRPTNDIEAYHVRQYALESVRIERCQEIERGLLRSLMLRASDPLAWDEDRRLEAAEIGARLSRDPARACLQLRQTAQGCDWLVERWERLAKIADEGRTWDESQRSLALDLLGTPAPFRGGPGAADPGEGPEPAAPQRDLAHGQIAELRRLRERVLLPRDAEERQAACLGIDVVTGPTQRALRLARRYESESQRRLHQSMRLIFSGRLVPGASESPNPSPTNVLREATHTAHPIAPPAPAPAPSPARVEPPALEDDAMELEILPEVPTTSQPSPTDARPRGNRRWRKEQMRRQRAGQGAA